MVIFCFCSNFFSSSSSSSLLSLKPPNFSTSLPKLNYHNNNGISTKRQKIFKKNGVCRAELSSDAPFVAAIGACMLSSLVLPNAVSSEEDGDWVIDSTDSRLTVMGIISFIPYFNWLSWVFAWLDSGKRRYGVYAFVYLAPYLRSNMSLSPEESWLPIASIVLGVIHVQLEVSIKNGDLEGFQVFKETANYVLSMMKKKEIRREDHQESFKDRKEHRNLLSTEDRSRNEIGQQRVPKKPSEHLEHTNGDRDDNEDDKWKIL